MKPLDTEDSLVAELLPAFIQEAEEQVASLEQLLLELEQSPTDPRLLDALFRCAHTVKGSAGVFGLSRIVAFTHHVETLLDRLREGRLALDPGLSTLLLEANDEIRQLVAHARDGTAPGDEADATASARARLVERLKAAAGGPAEAGTERAARAAVVPSTAAASVIPAAAIAADEATASRRWRIRAGFGTEVFRHGMDPLSILDYLAGLGAIEDLVLHRANVPALDAIDPESCHLAVSFDFDTAVDREAIEHAFGFVRDDCELDLQAPTTAEPPATPRACPAAGATPPATTGPGASASPGAGTCAATSPDEGGYIRVHANRLDEVINLLGELVIAGAGASMLARETRQRPLIEANRQITRLIEGIRNSTLKLRMVPIGETFARFRRVVRDTAHELGKSVALEIVGGDTELDKAVVERIADPLMHLVRNALDHGIETTGQRVAAGKPAQGRLTLSACHEAGSILIRIADDGRGIQRDKVLERAWQRGLVERGTVPPDDEILGLIFEPGFSTAEQVTQLSGRGVGMDVVRSNIESLRGSVVVQSAPGEGSAIEIRLPLTLAIIDGFLVAVAGSHFIVPLDAVVEVISSRVQDLRLDAGGRGCVDLRGRLLPVIDLRTLYALGTATPARASIVVVRAGTRRYGVVVDSLLGQHQTVIKPLGQLLRSLRGVSGSSILGTGDVALIFDVDALGQIAAGTRGTHLVSRRPPTTGEPAPVLDTLPAGERT